MSELETYAKLERRMATVEHKLDKLLNNHLAHIQSDMFTIRKYVVWGVGIILALDIAILYFGA